MKIVLGSMGLDIPESELRTLCDCTPFGTNALKAIDAARRLGFAKSSKHNLSVEELESLIAGGHYPIALINLDPIDGINDSHALVIIEISNTNFVVYDPLHGERTLPRESFSAAWAMMKNLVILIEQ